ncbi:MAG: helix-turn-helix domain-containing protein [Lacisediminihabitans sp.]
MTAPHSQAAQVLGKRVREYRLQLGLSQEDIADLAEMHVTNLGKIERGQANPSLTTIIRVAGVLGVDPAELIRGLGLAQIPSRSHRLTAADLIRERRRRDR